MCYFDDMMEQWASPLPVNRVVITDVTSEGGHEVLVGHEDNEGNILHECSIEVLFSEDAVAARYKWFSNHMPHVHQYILINT